MKVFALDISTKTGWAYFVDGKVEKYGLIQLERKLKNEEYPEGYVEFAQSMATKIKSKINEIVSSDFWDQGMILIEETSKSRAVYTQKILEFIHCLFLKPFVGKGYEIKYVRTGEWRRAVNLVMTKEDKEHNKLVKKKLARGKITPKHLSVRMANKVFGLSLKLKDNDIADALVLGLSYYYGVKYTEGINDKRKVKKEDCKKKKAA